MSLIEEALRRVQETPPPAPVVRTPPPPPAADDAESAAPAPVATARPVLVQPGGGGSIPPTVPSPITVSGLGAAVLSVGLLIVVSAVTLRQSSMSTPRTPRAAVTLAAAPAAPAPATAPAPAAAAVETAPPPAAPPGTPTRAEHPASPSAAKPVSAGDPLAAVPGFEAPQFILNGVVRGKGDPLAIINGKILKVGDGIEGATLAEIAQDSARLRWPDRELIIRINR